MQWQTLPLLFSKIAWCNTGNKIQFFLLNSCSHISTVGTVCNGLKHIYFGFTVEPIGGGDSSDIKWRFDINLELDFFCFERALEINTRRECPLSAEIEKLMWWKGRKRKGERVAGKEGQRQQPLVSLSLQIVFVCFFDVVQNVYRERGVT